MRIQKMNRWGVKVLISCAVLSSGVLFNGCAAVQRQRVSAQGKSYELAIKGSPGQVERVDYYTQSAVKTFSDDQIAREKIESMMFRTASEVKEVAASTGQIKQVVVVLEKDGPMDLHDMAFPELGESLEVVYTPQAKVVRAGSYPTDSIFYVPPISLPEKAVEVGDTWEMKSEWTSVSNAIGMQLDLVTIFKQTLSCGGDICADLEVSGEVSVPGLRGSDFAMTSHLKGRILFAVNAGTVVWSHIRNSENVLSQGDRVEINSCLTSSIDQAPLFPKSQRVKPMCLATGQEAIELPF